MKPFLIENGREYSYETLVQDINRDSFYCPLLQTNDLYLFFVNLVKALSCNQPVVLLDSDLKGEEISGIDLSLINNEETIPDYKCITTIEEVIEKLIHSSSKITIFTSGTTGQPKQVTHSVSSLTRAVRIGDKYQGQIWAFAYNPTHMAGLQVFFQAFVNQNLIINVFNQNRQDVYRLIDQYQITHISGTPTFYRLLLPFERTFESVARVTLGGEKSDNHLHESIKKIFPNSKINNVYASTEAGSLFAAKGDSFQIPSTIRDKFKIEDDELLIHKSLLGQSESFDFIGDYYRSGDLIEWIDKDNSIFRFKSRKNELINVGGYKVNPSEIESVILGIEGVQQVVVYGRPNSILGNVLCADIQMDPQITIDEFEIRRHLKTQLQDFKIPRRIKFVDKLSLTRTGKIKRI